MNSTHLFLKGLPERMVNADQRYPQKTKLALQIRYIPAIKDFEGCELFHIGKKRR
jgi:hypothetical protein